MPQSTAKRSRPQPPRLGDLLIKRGTLSAEQCVAVLATQKSTGRPFGELAERMFNVDPRELESAWAEQYQAISGTIDPCKQATDVRVVSMISPRQAWQFRIVPLRFDGAEIMICTSREHLPRALRFAYSHFGPSCYFVLAAPDALAKALNHHYPMPGAEQEFLNWHAAQKRAAGA